MTTGTKLRKPRLTIDRIRTKIAAKTGVTDAEV